MDLIASSVRVRVIGQPTRSRGAAGPASRAVGLLAYRVAGILARVPDLGDPTSYLELADGLPVFSSAGERIGVVEHVLADADVDIFDGLVIDSRTGPGGHRFADATQVAGLYERGAVLALDTAACERLPEPSASPAVLEADPDDTAPDDLGDKLKRAWNVISGNY